MDIANTNLQTYKLQITGCTEVEASIAELQVTDCNVHSVSLKALFVEEGTGVEEEKSSRKSIDRTAVRFKTVYKDDYMKPNLPYTIKASVFFCVRDMDPNNN